MPQLHTHLGVDLTNLIRGAIESDFSNYGERYNTGRLATPGWPSRKVCRISNNDNTAPVFADAMSIAGVQNGSVSSGPVYDRVIKSCEYVSSLMDWWGFVGPLPSGAPSATMITEAFSMATPLHVELIADAIENEMLPSASQDPFLSDMFDIMNNINVESTGYGKFWQFGGSNGTASPSVALADIWRSIVSRSLTVTSSQYAYYESRKRYAHTNNVCRPLILNTVTMRPSGIQTYAKSVATHTSYYEYNEWSYATTRFTTSEIFLKKDPAGQFQTGGLQRCPVFNGQSGSGYIPDNTILGHGSIPSATVVTADQNAYRNDHTTSSTIWLECKVHEDVEVAVNSNGVPTGAFGMNFLYPLWWSITPTAPTFRYKAFDEDGNALELANFTAPGGSAVYEGTDNQAQAVGVRVQQLDTSARWTSTSPLWRLEFKTNLRKFDSWKNGKRSLRKGTIQLGIPGNILFWGGLYTQFLFGGYQWYDDLNAYLTSGGSTYTGLGMLDSDSIEWRFASGLENADENEDNLSSNWANRFDPSTTLVYPDGAELFNYTYGEIEPLIFDFAVTP